MIGVKQGDIVYVDLNPIVGHEQQGMRPCLIVSNDVYNRLSSMRILLPITNTKRRLLAVELPEGLKTTGSILCQHIRSVDLGSRKSFYVEPLPQENLAAVLEILKNEI